MPAWHLRPRSAPEIVDASVQLLKQHARSLLLMSVVLMIPSAVIGLINALIISDIQPTGGAAGVLSTMQIGFGVPLFPLVLIGAGWFVVAFCALVIAASAAYVDGTVIEPAEALRRVFPRVGVMLGAGVLTYLLVTLQLMGLMMAFLLVAVMISGAAGALGGASGGATGTAGVFGFVTGLATVLAVLCGGAWLVGRYATLPAVLVNESLGVRDTMRRARELSRGSVARVTALMLLVGLLFLVVTGGGFLVLTMLLHSTAAASVLLSVVNVPVYALGATLATVLYYDLRIRHEGLDIELLANELADGPSLAGQPLR